MMAFTKDGQSDDAMIAKRDAHYGTNSEETKAYRASRIDFPEKTSPAADHWEQGNGAYQLQLVKKEFKKSTPICWHPVATPMCGQVHASLRE